MTDDRPIGVMEHLARLARSLSIPISAALGLAREGPILQVYRFVDAVDFVLQFVVAHGAGVAYRAGTPIGLLLPDHPSINDWQISAARLAKAVERGALPNWGGRLVITALTKAMVRLPQGEEARRARRTGFFVSCETGYFTAQAKDSPSLAPRLWSVNLSRLLRASPPG